MSCNSYKIYSQISNFINVILQSCFTIKFEISKCFIQNKQYVCMRFTTIFVLKIPLLFESFFGITFIGYQRQTRRSRSLNFFKCYIALFQPICFHLGQLSRRFGVWEQPVIITVVWYSTNGWGKCKERIVILYHFQKMVWYLITGNLTNEALSFPFLFFPFPLFLSFQLRVLCRRLHDGGFTDLIDSQDPIPPKWYKWLDDVAPISITPEMKFAGRE